MKLACDKLLHMADSNLLETNGDYRDQTKYRFRAWPLG